MHAQAPHYDATDWAQIIGLYDALLRVQPSPIIELNRAVAVAMHNGPAAGLMLVDRLLTLEPIKQYHLAHAARADLCRRLGRFDDARDAYLAALGLTQQLPEKAFIERRLGALGASQAA